MQATEFDAQMNRLAAAYRTEVAAETRAAWWMELSGKDATRLDNAISAVIRTAPSFPTVALLMGEMDRAAYRARAETPQLTEGEGYEIGRRNAARLALHGLPSDAMIAHGGGRRHGIGTPEWTGILKMYDRLIATLEARVAEREGEAQARPHDTDIQRRLLVLVRTLGETVERRDHFAKTGETLALGALVTA